MMVKTCFCSLLLAHIISFTIHLAQRVTINTQNLYIYFFLKPFASSSQVLLRESKKNISLSFPFDMLFLPCLFFLFTYIFFRSSFTYSLIIKFYFIFFFRFLRTPLFDDDDDDNELREAASKNNLYNNSD